MFLYLSLLDNEEDQIYFEKLYEKYAEDMFKRIYDTVKNQHDAEDVMQETWLSVAENIEFCRAKNERTIRAYIFRIAKNRSFTFYRKRRKEEEWRSDVDLVDLKDPCDYENILFNMCAKIDVEIIIECINSLDEIYSDILNYFYLHDHTIKEISKILKLKEDTVRTRLYRGRIKLLQMLEGRNLNADKELSGRNRLKEALERSDQVYLEKHPPTEEEINWFKADLEMKNMEVIEALPISNQFYGSVFYSIAYDNPTDYKNRKQIGFQAYDMQKGEAAILTYEMIGLEEDYRYSILCVDENYVYFTQNKEEQILIGTRPPAANGRVNKVYSNETGKLYRMKHDGTECTLIYDNPNFEFKSLEAVVCGNQIIFSGQEYATGTDGYLFYTFGGMLVGTMGEDGKIEKLEMLEFVY